MINLHHLLVFDAVAAEGNVSRGAERLGISQPAVSKQLRDLERRLKTPLFDRHPKGVRLTAAGEALADYTRRIFALAEEAERALADVAGLRRGHLAVGAGPTVGVYLLPRVLVEFRRRFPDVTMHAETEGSDVLRHRLLDGVLDLAISEARADSTELDSAIVARDVLVPVVAAKHRLASRRSVSAAEFCREPFIARQTQSGEKSLVERTLASRGLGIQPVLTVSSTEAIKQAVMAGLGVAMVSKLAVRTEVAAGQLAVLAVKGLSIRYPIYHVRRRDRSPSAAAAAFLELFKAAVQQLDR
jgi:DNA-binding transcriptional LysR family regulator